MTDAVRQRRRLKPVDRRDAGLRRVAIEIVGMNKWFGQFHVLRDIDLTVYKGERIVVCGPSGSGKSTLIRCINRLEEHQKGKIVVDGVELTSDLKNIDRIRSEVGMVFQHFNLFPHLTILENCTLAPIWVRKTPKRRPRRSRCTSSPRSASPSRREVSRASSPAASSSGWRSPARSA
jgi:general L-amino acid transport system ATP-binding protein